MRKVFTSKQQRKQAEDSIMRDMRKILSELDHHKQIKETQVNKEQVMAVLTKFLQLKKQGKMH